MNPDEKVLSIVVADDGRSLSIFFEHRTPMSSSAESTRQKLVDFHLYASDGSWQEWNHRHIGRVVLGALNLYPNQSPTEVSQSKVRLLSTLKRLEDEENQGLWDTNSLITRSILELVVYRQTGNIRHLDNVEKLYQMLSELGSEEHIETLKGWKAERARLIRCFLDSNNYPESDV